MSKTIIIWAIVIIVIIGGVFVYWKYGMNTETTAQNNTNQPAAAATPSTQVAGQDITVGTGKEATPGSAVSIIYVGMFQDGTVFDSTEKNGNVPLTFVLGAEGIIPGFQIGVNGMKEGGERRISVPPQFGYGDQDLKDPAGKTIIPANSTILFDIKLVKVEATTTAPARP